MLGESHRPGIEPTTCKLQVQRPTAKPPCNRLLEVISVTFSGIVYHHRSVCRQTANTQQCTSDKLMTGSIV